MGIERFRFSFCCIVGAATLALGGTTAPAQQFTDVTDAAGITFMHASDGEFPAQVGHAVDLPPGAAAADYDNDGWIDLFLANGYRHANHLYHNLGDGTFEEVAGALGVAMPDDESSSGLFLDYDNDGWLDLLVLVNGHPSEPLPTSVQHRLFRNIAGTRFADVTATAGIPRTPYVQFEGNLQWPTLGGSAAADLDSDGDLEVYICYWRGRDILLRNNGNGTFSDITDESGIDSDADDAWMPVIHDFSGDGLPDLFITRDFAPDLLLVNEGDLTFVDQAVTAGLAGDDSEMGAALGDFDRDGDFDLYISNIERPYGGTPLAVGNALLRNDSTSTAMAYEDVAEEAGVRPGGYGWGVSFLDFDNDGWLDLAGTNGRRQDDPGFMSDVGRLWRNLGYCDDDAGAFEDVSVQAGVTDARLGRSLVSLDYDRDGDVDFLVTNHGVAGLSHEAPGKPILFRNDWGSTNHWLVVDPVAVGGNTRAIGARVEVTAGGIKQVQAIRAGTSFIGQEPDEAHFGLGTADRVELVRVVWPDGLVQVVENAEVDAVLTVERPEALLDPVALRITGPTNVPEMQLTPFAALAELSDGTVIDVTAEASWRGEPEEFTAFLIPGSLITGDVLPGEYAARVHATFAGLEAFVDIVVASQDPGVDAPPSITILEPQAAESVATSEETIELRGIVEGGADALVIIWSNGRGDSGAASGTREWATGPIPLVVGNNNISITVTCANGNSDVARLKVTRLRMVDAPDAGDPPPVDEPPSDSGGTPIDGGTDGPSGGRGDTPRDSSRIPYPCGTAGMIPLLLFGWLSGWRWRSRLRRMGRHSRAGGCILQRRTTAHRAMAHRYAERIVGSIH